MLGVSEGLVMISGVYRMVSIIYNREERGGGRGRRG
jgi:hypothetical protein